VNNSEQVVDRDNPVICWWSGGVTSAVACMLAIDMYGKENCRLIMIDTGNESNDTYRFKSDCEKWYGKDIEQISAVGPKKKYDSIEDVWYDFLSLNAASGAICSSELKRQVRIDFQRRNGYSFQVFGFDSSEPLRAINLKKNYPATNPMFPLLEFNISKEECIGIIQSKGIGIPDSYEKGFRNNNCFKTGCVRGGVGYWKKIQSDFPEKFEAMAKREHEITNLKGQPCTILKDQSKKAKASGRVRVFLKPHPDYPELKSIDDMKGRPVEPLVECNGFCGMSK
jgi:hypothetical protein